MLPEQFLDRMKQMLGEEFPVCPEQAAVLVSGR